MNSILEYYNEQMHVSLLNYLLESKEDVDNSDNEENEDMKKMRKAAQDLFALLKEKKSLTDYVGTLNEILKGEKTNGDDNTKLYLETLAKLFSGDGDADGKAYDKYSCKGESIGIAIKDLYPTQSEIDIENSAKWAKKKKFAKNLDEMFGDKPFGQGTIPVPVLVYNDGKKNWIIDGHHRWSQVGLINYDAELNCMVIEGKESVRDFLKLTQSIIAGVIAKRNDFKKATDKEQTIPVGKAKPENNIFGDALKGDKIKERMKELLHHHGDIVEHVFKVLVKNKVLNNKGEVIEEGLKTKVDGICELVMKNRDKMIANHQAPEEWATPRPVMPQTDRAGNPTPDDNKTSDKGSALNKIRNMKALPNLEYSNTNDDKEEKQTKNNK